MRSIYGVLAVLAGSCASSPPAARPVSDNQAMFSSSDAYERYMGRWSRLVAPELVRFAGVRDGDAVLDVGSGTGVLAFAVRQVDPSGAITGVDPSQDYVRFASEHAPDERVRFQVGDGQALEFADASFDRTLSLLVVNFIPDAPRAVREMARVTRPGGLVAAAVWDYGDGMQMLRLFWDEAVAFDPTLSGRDEKNMRYCGKGELAALWKQEGLQDVEEQPIEVTFRFASFDDYWSPFLLGQGPAGAYVARLSADRQAGLAARLRKRLLGDGPDHAFELPARVWAVKGVVAAK